LVNQVDKNVHMLASNLLQKIADGESDVVAGTEQLFLMIMRTAKYDEQIRRLELVTVLPTYLFSLALTKTGAANEVILAKTAE
jgi:hypothetical protein